MQNKNLVIAVLLGIISMFVAFEVWDVLNVFQNIRDPLHIELYKEALESEEGYTFGDTLTCRIKKSSTEAKEGDEFSFYGLTTNNPLLKGKQVYGTELPDLPFQNFFESPHRITLGQISKDGAVDMFVLDKKNGVFGRIGFFDLGNIDGSFSKGTCR